MLLTTLLHREKVFFQFAASHSAFRLILHKRTFFACVWLTYNGFASFWLGCAVFSDNPATWDEHLDFCVISVSVHSSTGHNPFDLMFGREMRIPLDVMVGGAEDNECSCTDFVAVELHRLHNT